MDVNKLNALLADTPKPIQELLAGYMTENFTLRSTLNTIATAKWEPSCNWRGAAEWLQDLAREAIMEAK